MPKPTQPYKTISQLMSMNSKPNLTTRNRIGTNCAVIRPNKDYFQIAPYLSPTKLTKIYNAETEQDYLHTQSNPTYPSPIQPCVCMNMKSKSELTSPKLTIFRHTITHPKTLMVQISWQCLAYQLFQFIFVFCNQSENSDMVQFKRPMLQI